ncbi:hypothetical protein [Aureimonas sp. SK2]|uniref:hypothetical protein n=1 Tax=Aureimonas sp. SK2 TaxID=3015992 RepID=UPI0024449BB7|nr:hypothetical protein [Aureimonas sp. SK2]
MVSFRSGASRSVSLSAPQMEAEAPRPAGRVVTNGAADLTIRRDFDALAARIRVLQARIQREAASLHAR